MDLRHFLLEAQVWSLGLGVNRIWFCWKSSGTRGERLRLTFLRMMTNLPTEDVNPF